jgi:hypothetical protein
MCFSAYVHTNLEKFVTLIMESMYSMCFDVAPPLRSNLWNVGRTCGAGLGPLQENVR